MLSNLKDLGQIYAGTRREYPSPLYGPTMFNGQPFMVVQAHNSTTGRHGSGKTNILYELLLSGARSNRSFDTDTRVMPWKDAPHYGQGRGVLISVKPPLVKTYDTIEQVSLSVLRGATLPDLGAQVHYKTWRMGPQTHYIYLR